MHTFQGDQALPMAAPELWQRLRDPAFLVQCLPDAVPEGTTAPERATFSVQPNLGFVRGRLDVVLQLVEAKEPTVVHWHLSSKSVAASSEADIVLTLTPQANGSSVHWQATITQLGGLLRMVPGGLIRGAAQKVIGDVWNNVAQKLK